MGNCLPCCTQVQPSTIYRIALKFPHGLTGITYDDATTTFVDCVSIDTWLQSLYSDSKWTNWLAYNDETGHLGDHSHKKGHCKGIVAWNATRISWLVHSVPNFPRLFTGQKISTIEPGEHIYGQSFCYVERVCDTVFLQQVLTHLMLMEPHIFIKHQLPVIHLSPTISQVHVLNFSDTISHHAKSPKLELDIYGSHLTVLDPSIWYVETWKRGLPIPPSTNVTEVSTVTWKQTIFKESQDHSKWAVSSTCVWMGDLNRMTSQFKRGGGGFIIKNNDMVRVCRQLIGK